ncbi:hypothetical protein MNBD_UNCLBAC01-316 [hydrothermal vent metagenome]|uniref:Exonuclease domain-containing protein n=1 Tax=hydrothermal vent metagenome TaxID=652676 RepID=A0A3B1E1X8_9ZZZZ
MKIKNTLVVLDLETTGTWVDKDKIIEIAMIKLMPDGTEERYDKRVNPQIPIPPVVTELTGISNEDVEDKPLFQELALEILEFVKDVNFGGFNLERFDLPVLERELKDSGHRFDWKLQKIYDGQKVFHLNQKRDLTAAYEFYCDKSLENAHSAMADTEATLAILQAQTKKYGKENSLEELEQFQYTKTAEFYDDDKRFRWWNGKLYMMFGKYARFHSLQDVAKRDSGYLKWIASANFSDEVKTLVQNAINGRFPIPNY